MRLIDAERIVYSWTIDNDGEEHDGVTLQSIIDKLPTVDAEPVVRCKDCKFYWKNDRDSNGVVCLATPKDDAFCSEGERREDAKTN